MKKILIKSITVIVLTILVFILPLFYPTGIAVYFRLFVLILILVESLKLFKMMIIDHGHEPRGKLRDKMLSAKRDCSTDKFQSPSYLKFESHDQKINALISNSATVLFSVFILFIVLEAVFMFIPRSHSADFTLASKLWYARYWTVNSLGFRDHEPDGSKPVILFVGDSFTAGHGLKSVNDRFSNIVDQALNQKEKKFSVINISMRGLDSKAEYKTMKNFFYLTRIKPKVIVLQYFGNDIAGAAEDQGLIFDGFKPPPDLSKFVMFLGSGSYFLNYIYWLFPREYLGAPYINYFDRAYKNKDILVQHEKDLGLFIDYSRKNSARLIVVVFPFLVDIGMSDSMYVNEIVNFFESNGISVINVSRLAKEMPLSERTVNNNDTHASKKLNRIVAEEIIKKIQSW